MTLTPEKLAKLRELAQSATPGNKPNPRVPTREIGYYVRRCYDEYQVFGDDAEGKLTHVASVYDKADAAYIAAADPQTVLALVEEVERLQARVAELETVMAQRMGVYAAPKDERQVGS